MTTAPRLAELTDILAGSVLVPGTPPYDAVRRPANARFADQRPEVIVRCAAPDDVRAAIAFATAHQLPLAVRSGGHSFAGQSSTTGLLLDVSPMDGISLDGDIARVGGGTRQGDLYAVAATHGRTIVGGCGMTVGVSGLILGGGIGLLGRQHGFACDSLRAAEVVLADGRLVHCSEDEEPDLFWAIRGAGAVGVGVVTALYLGTIAMPGETTTFRVRWPWGQAAALVDGWQRWSPMAPRELACSLIAEVPQQSSREPTLSMIGAMTGSESAFLDQLDSFSRQASVQPASLETRHGSYLEAKRLLAGPNPYEDAIAHSASEFFPAAWPPAASTALITRLTVDRVDGQSRQLDLSPIAGAYNDPASGATAFAHRDQQFLVKHEVVMPAGSASEAALARGRDWLADSARIAAEHGSGRAYPNFPDPALGDPMRAYWGDNAPRLQRLKRIYDPQHLFDSGVPPS
jgi:FAD/FMN-containing dehydrogenase